MLNIRPHTIFTVFVSVVIFSFTIPSAHAYQYVQVQGRQLLTDFNEDGDYEPFLVEGVGYSPTPIGRHVSDWGYDDISDPRPDNIYNDPDILDRDFSLLKEMNANAIRIWKADDSQEGTRYPNKLTQTTLNKAQEYNIKVIPGFWLPNEGYWSCTDGGPVYTRNTNFSDPNLRADILNRFSAFVQEFKDHPAILFWALGNENNLSFGDDPENIKAFFSLVDELAAMAHQIEGASYHPVAYINGDLGHVGSATFGSTDADLPNLDIWGANVYRGDSFGNLFEDYKALSSKPFWISEFGLDAWHANDLQNPDDGYEDQETQAQYAASLWDEIVANNDTVVGGTIMEYSDELWKPYEWICDENSSVCNLVQNHFGFGPVKNCPDDGGFAWIPPAPDQMLNEEWWGVVRVSPSSEAYKPDIMTPRQVYYTLQSKFTAQNNPPTINSISDRSAFENQTITIATQAFDVEGSDLVLTSEILGGNPLSDVGATFVDNGDGTGVFQWNVQYIEAYGSSVTFVIKARDDAGQLGVEQFRVDVRVLATMISPPESTVLDSNDVTFTWNAGEHVSTYVLQIGTTPGGIDILNQFNGSNKSFRVTNIPQDGRPVYVRLWSGVGLYSLRNVEYVYQTQGGVITNPAEIISPTDGTVLNTSNVTFTWNEGINVTDYTFMLGTSPGGNDIFEQRNAVMSATVNGLVLDGQAVYARLVSHFAGSEEFYDYTYQTIDATPVENIPPAMISPAVDEMITTTEVDFEWSAGEGVAEYYIYVGTSQGRYDLYNSSMGTSTAVTVTGMPAYGSKVYVRLWYRFAVATSTTTLGWKYIDYSYDIPDSRVAPALTLPTTANVLSSSTATFTWSAGQQVAYYYLYIGTSPGSSNIFNFSSPNQTSITVNDLPMTGQPIYVRLWYRFNGAWSIGGSSHYIDYVFQTGDMRQIPALTSPATTDILDTESVTFQWTPGDDIAQYYFSVGRSPARFDIYNQSADLNTSVTVNGIVQNGGKVYVRLWYRFKSGWSYVSGGWKFIDYVYDAGN